MLYVSSAFSLNMLDGNEHEITVTPLTYEQARTFIRDKEFTSIVGHQGTAAIISELLGRNVSYNRMNTILTTYDAMLIGQYIGARLPEGTIVLPADSHIEFYYLFIKE